MPWPEVDWKAINEEEFSKTARMFRKEMLGEWVYLTPYATLRGADTFYPALDYRNPPTGPQSVSEAVERAFCKAFHAVFPIELVTVTSRGHVYRVFCTDCENGWVQYPRPRLLTEAVLDALSGIGKPKQSYRSRNW